MRSEQTAYLGVRVLGLLINFDSASILIQYYSLDMIMSFGSGIDIPEIVVKEASQTFNELFDYQQRY